MTVIDLWMVQVAEADELTSSAAPFGFTITGGNRSLVVSASCPEEKLLWMEELQSAIRAAKHRGDSVESSIILYPSLKSNSKFKKGYVTCHVGLHSVTCHPTRVNTPRHNPSQAGWYLIYLPQRDGRLS